MKKNKVATEFAAGKREGSREYKSGGHDSAAHERAESETFELGEQAGRRGAGAADYEPDESMNKFDCNHNVGCDGEGRSVVKTKEWREHETVPSRFTPRQVEIGLGPTNDGRVPANPFASLAQAGYMHSHPEVLGKKALGEWDAATKGKHLPKHVKSYKHGTNYVPETGLAILHKGEAVQPAERHADAEDGSRGLPIPNRRTIPARKK